MDSELYIGMRSSQDLGAAPSAWGHLLCRWAHPAGNELLPGLGGAAKLPLAQENGGRGCCREAGWRAIPTIPTMDTQLLQPD